MWIESPRSSRSSRWTAIWSYTGCCSNTVNAMQKVSASFMAGLLGAPGGVADRRAPMVPQSGRRARRAADGELGAGCVTPPHAGTPTFAGGAVAGLCSSARRGRVVLGAGPPRRPARGTMAAKGACALAAAPPRDIGSAMPLPKTPALLTTALAAALLLAGAAARAEIAVPDLVAVGTRDATTVIGGTAVPALRIDFTSSFVLAGGWLNLDYDPAALTFLPGASRLGGASFGDLAALLQPGHQLDWTPGAIRLSGSLPVDAQPDVTQRSLPLQLAFQGRQLGVQPVGYALGVIADTDDVFDFGGTLRVTVTPVPEPAPAALLLAGLAAVGLLARRRTPG